MKRLLSALALVSICSLAFGQVVITSSNYYIPGNTVRDIFTVENDATDSIATSNFVSNPFNASNSLENVFGIYGLIDTIAYSEPNTEGEFIEETVSFANEAGMRMHIKVTDAKAVCLGVSGAIAEVGLTDDIEFPFDEPMDVISFPAELNSETHSNAHGQYLKHISEMQPIFDSITYGAQFYNMLIAEYDSIDIDISVTYSSLFDESGNMALTGDRMMQGTYEYLRENRQHTYVTNMYLHKIGEENFTDINECMLTISDPIMAYFLGGSSVNLGSVMNELMGISFPKTSTTTTLNYWIANDNYPIVEIETNADCSYAKKLAIRYGENQVCVGTQEIAVSIYPNPTSDFLNIETEEMGQGSISIYSVNGSLVKEEKINGTHNSINVSSLRNGNYFFRISCGDIKINGNFAKN